MPDERPDDLTDLRAYYGCTTLAGVPFRWLPIALESLRGIEPYEVQQALAAPVRWPRLAYSEAGLPVLTIWARTDSGRGLIVAVRRNDPMDWDIIGVREMRRDEVLTFDEWEASR